ncbi:hypothetical protein [Hymenobacter sp. BRD67]|uniref:hypothetical protein n=1 Tax=Hymenobacter sp. BRD67 TaxID=2675877 RepID=UPI00156598AB|nr:hypothetical protein [Hymenobacter sp. BRD67]QKG52984.1 hypothetical protein GKZ67_10680 [Hymenobacter sp. BRD67]
MTLNKTFLVLAAMAALASCREANTSVQSRPTTTGGSEARALRFDTTFIKATGVRTYPHTYTGSMLVGQTKKIAVPVQINWTTVQESGCAQVAAVQVYQLNADDRRTHLMAKAMRDAVCRPGQLPAGGSSPATSSAPYTGAAYLKLTCEAREIHRTTSINFTVNGLGYHDTLDGDAATPAQ